MAHSASILQQGTAGGCVCACRGWAGPAFWDTPKPPGPSHGDPYFHPRVWCIRMFFFLNAIRSENTWTLGLLSGIAAPMKNHGTVIPALLPFKTCCWDYSEDKAAGARNGNGGPWRMGSSSHPPAPTGQMLFDAWSETGLPSPEWGPGNPPPKGLRHHLLIQAEVIMDFEKVKEGEWTRMRQRGVRFTPSACAYY